MAQTTITPDHAGNSEEATTLAPVSARPNAIMTRHGIEPQTLDEAYRFATALSRSTIVPATYQKSPDNCLIALDLAARMNSNWLAVMQHVYVVHGRPGLDANLSIGLVNQSGQFEPIQYEEEPNGGDPKDPKYRVRAFSRRKGTNVTLYGPWIDWPTIKAEGWDTKEGSKWNSIPGTMFFYRAGAWWQKRHCPEMTLGMSTVDELEDTVDRKQVESRELTPTNGRKSFAVTDPPRPQAPEAERSPTESEPPAGDKPADPPAESNGARTGSPGSAPSSTPERDPLDGAPIAQPAAKQQDPPTQGKPACACVKCGTTFPNKIARGTPCPSCGSELGYKDLTRKAM